MNDRIWLIWSNEHRAWWAPNRCGYFTTVPPAGRYTTEEALRICEQRDPPEENVPAEIMVPSPEYIARLQQSPCHHDMRTMTRADVEDEDLLRCRHCGLTKRKESSYSRDYPY